MSVERILPNGMTETEFFNVVRVRMGLQPIEGKVTKIRPGLHVGCGCEIVDVAQFAWFIVERRNNCPTHKNERHVVRCTTFGQAVARIVEDGQEFTGVMRLDWPFPHEEPTSKGERQNMCDLRGCGDCAGEMYCSRGSHKLERCARHIRLQAYWSSVPALASSLDFKDWEAQASIPILARAMQVEIDRRYWDPIKPEG